VYLVFHKMKMYNRCQQEEKSMDSNQSAPTSLKIVAWLFILGGICSLMEVLVSLMRRWIDLNFGVLGLFIGRGLLRFSPGWRTCALVFLWIALIGVPIAALVLVGHRGPLDFSIFGQKVGYASKESGLVVCALVFGLALREYHVLTRRDVRALFGVD
jgi:hypothetical protein